MKWYSGDIAEAIKESKSRGAIFVVYIEGIDDTSKNVTALFENGVLGERLNSESFIAIKVQAGSLQHQQFSEFYRDPSVPSIYFIGKDGNPLDIIKDTDDLGTLNLRIDSILAKAGIVVELVPPQVQNSDPNCDIVCENDVCRIVKRDQVQNEGSASSQQRETQELTPEEKVERAKELLEAKRKLKEKEEEEKERMKELERRKMGQSVQELQRWQKEQELKQILEAREKEKLEEKLARERVLAQIKQDKEERLSKSQSLSPTTESAPKPVTSSPFQIKSDKTRLQFKLPDGSSNTQEFSISDTLETVIQYIKENLKLPFVSFKLSTTFPRREFTTGDYSQTLLDLQLCPNAVILILPQTNSALTTNSVGGSFTTFFWSLFGPIISIFGYLKSLIFGKTQNTTGTKRPPDDMGEPRPPNTKKRIMRDSTVVRRQGNIHRLTDRDSSDEEGNTWNGNSTQQM